MPVTGRKLLETERFSVETLRQETRSGQTRERPVIRHPGAVAILPMLADDRICLIRNHRIAVGQPLVELPAGTLERGEEPECTARRELIEETGFQAEKIAHLHSFFMSPGILDERMHVFVAEGLKPVGHRREETEQIENLIVSWEDALEMVRRGEIQDAKSLVGLLLYEQVKGVDA